MGNLTRVDEELEWIQLLISNSSTSHTNEIARFKEVFTDHIKQTIDIVTTILTNHADICTSMENMFSIMNSVISINTSLNYVAYIETLINICISHVST